MHHTPCTPVHPGATLLFLQQIHFFFQILKKPGIRIHPELEGIKNPEHKMIEFLVRMDHPDNLHRNKKNANLDRHGGRQGLKH